MVERRHQLFRKKIEIIKNVNLNCGDVLKQVYVLRWLLNNDINRDTREDQK